MKADEELIRRLQGPSIEGFVIESLVQNTGVYVYKAKSLHGVSVVVKAIDLYCLNHSLGAEQAFYHEKAIYDGASLDGVALTALCSGEVDGWAYVVLPFVKNGSVAQCLQYQSPDRTWVLSVFKQLLLCVNHLHEKGWVHRDLKPSNVLLGEGDIHLIDWGVAHKQGQLPQYFEMAKVYGSPAYMAPELTHGDGLGTIQSDLYSLGCIFYELLERQLPFQANTVQGLVYAHLEHPIPKLGQNNIVYQEVIDTLMDKSLEKRGVSTLQVHDWLSSQSQ